MSPLVNNSSNFEVDRNIDPVTVVKQPTNSTREVQTQTVTGKMEHPRLYRIT